MSTTINPGSDIRFRFHSAEEIASICDLTARVTALQVAQHPNICVETSVATTFHKLLTRLSLHKAGVDCLIGTEPYEK